jgi:hypothetical protein
LQLQVEVSAVDPAGHSTRSAFGSQAAHCAQARPVPKKPALHAQRDTSEVDPAEQAVVWLASAWHAAHAVQSKPSPK